MKQVDMEWDKIWSDNMRHLDKSAVRYMAVDDETKCRVIISNFAEFHNVDPSKLDSTIVSISVPLIPKFPEQGLKSVIVAPTLYIERVDMEAFAQGDLMGLMRYAVARVDEVDVAAGEIRVTLTRDADFRECEKNHLITWVSSSPFDVKVMAWEFDFILKEGKEDDELDNGSDDWRTSINSVSKANSTLVANAGVRTLQKGDFLQFERRGLFRVDKAYSNEDTMMELIKVPDGKASDMSTIKSKLDHR